MGKTKESIFHITTPELAIRWRNFLLGCAVPAALWTIANEINGLFIDHSLLPAFDTTLDSSTRAYLIVTKVAIPFALTALALESSERAHMKYRELDPHTPPRGLGEKIYDVLAWNSPISSIFQ